MYKINPSFLQYAAKYLCFVKYCKSNYISGTKVWRFSNLKKIDEILTILHFAKLKNHCYWPENQHHKVHSCELDDMCSWKTRKRRVRKKSLNCYRNCFYPLTSKKCENFREIVTIIPCWSVRTVNIFWLL